MLVFGDSSYIYNTKTDGIVDSKRKKVKTGRTTAATSTAISNLTFENKVYLKSLGFKLKQ